MGGTHDIVGNHTFEGMLRQRADDLDDMITATGTAFLGLTVNCGRCHDHKFDPITQRDYYGSRRSSPASTTPRGRVPLPDLEWRRAEAAASRRRAGPDRPGASTSPSLWPAPTPRSRPALMVNPRRNIERFSPVPARMVRMTVLATSNQTEPCIDELEVYHGHGGAIPAQRGAGVGRRQGLGLLGVSRCGDSQDRASQRRPARQQP